jgi:hypothetical protein
VQTQHLERAAAQVAAKRKEIELRLAQLHEAKYPWDKLAHARLVASAFFELQDHQNAFNQAAIAAIAELQPRVQVANA